MDTWLSPRGGRPCGVVVGTMNFGRRTPEAEARRIVERALERGVPLLDTANVYNDGESERILGRALAGRRGRARVATKVGSALGSGPPEGLSRARVRAACEESLGRLGIETIDLYYLHRPDPRTPFEETLEALQALLQEGKILHWGVSNFASWQILELNGLSARAGMPLPAVSQVIYNLLVRQLDVEYFAFTRAHPLHTTVYNPLAGGLLTGKALRQEPERGGRFDGNPMYQRRYLSERFFAQVEAYQALAREAGMSLTELAYRFVASRPGVDSVLLGPATLEHLDAGLEACARPLPPEVGTQVDALHRAYLGTDATYARLA
jgi:aryl-alcohol dehydrogenase-like predicted oxidoreductase